MFTTKKEAEQKAKEVKGKVLELKKAMDGNLFAVVVIGKGLTKEEVELTEAFFKIDIPTMPSAYVESNSKSAIKTSLRGILKSDALKEISIEKVSKGEMKKSLIDMSKGSEVKEDSTELAEEHGDNIEHFRDIVDNRQEKNVKFSDRTMKVDMWTASAIISVYDTVNKGNQERIAELANGSTKDLFRLQTVVTKLVSKTSSLRR